MFYILTLELDSFLNVSYNNWIFRSVSRTHSPDLGAYESNVESFEKSGMWKFEQQKLYRMFTFAESVEQKIKNAPLLFQHY